MTAPDLLPLFNVAFASGTTVWQIRTLLLADASSEWQQTNGKVLKAFVDESRTYDEDGSEVTHSANVRYTYWVGARRMESTRLTYRPTRGLAFSESIHLLHGITQGREVDVFYDPRRPERAVLIPGRSSGNLLHLAVAGAWLAIAIWYILP